MVVSLPLMRKTFIEAVQPATILTACVESLPLMRKTFIEALKSLSLRIWRQHVSSAYAEDFH